MCGIAGAIQLKGGRMPDPDLIIRMCDLLHYRGPDGEGFMSGGMPDNSWLSQLQERRPAAVLSSAESPSPFVLGHRRLSIVDLSRDAGQPMSSTGKEVWIVFNGEIYNHAELRLQLEAKGHRFHTDHSDTEVILNGYLEWGTDLLCRMNGMFSFCLWDSRKNRFWFARDRFGVKPFYYTVHQGVFYFASEMKALLLIPGIPLEIIPQSVSDILTFSSVPPPRTMLEGIYKMPPSHSLLIENGSLRKPRRYYQPLDAMSKVSLTDETMIRDGIRELLKDAVEYRRGADVQYGAFLSGGVDSASNLAMLSKTDSLPVKSFSMSFRGNLGNYVRELVFAEEVSKLFHSNHFGLVMTEDHYYGMFDKMLFHCDEPVADTASIPIYLLSLIAKQNGVTVCLGGEGSDEIFAGYSLWKIHADFELFFKKFGLPGLPRLARASWKLPGLKNRRTFYHGWFDRVISGYPTYWGGTEAFSDGEKTDMFSESFRKTLADYKSFDGISRLYDEYLAYCPIPHPYNWMTYLELHFRLPEILLSRLDRMSMAASVEARVPFLDYRLVEFALRIKPDLKVKNGIHKYPLKEAMRGYLPDKIIDRKKESFNVPLNKMTRDLSDMEKTFDEFNKNTGIFEKEQISKIFRQGNSYRKWVLLNLGMWWKGTVSR